MSLGNAPSITGDGGTACLATVSCSAAFDCAVQCGNLQRCLTCEFTSEYCPTRYERYCEADPAAVVLVAVPVVLIVGLAVAIFIMRAVRKHMNAPPEFPLEPSSTLRALIRQQRWIWSICLVFGLVTLIGSAVLALASICVVEDAPFTSERERVVCTTSDAPWAFGVSAALSVPYLVCCVRALWTLFTHHPRGMRLLWKRARLAIALLGTWCCFVVLKRIAFNNNQRLAVPAYFGVALTFLTCNCCCPCIADYDTETYHYAEACGVVDAPAPRAQGQAYAPLELQVVPNSAVDGAAGAGAGAAVPGQMHYEPYSAAGSAAAEDPHQPSAPPE